MPAHGLGSRGRHERRRHGRADPDGVAPTCARGPPHARVGHQNARAAGRHTRRAARDPLGAWERQTASQQAGGEANPRGSDASLAARPRALDRYRHPASRRPTTCGAGRLPTAERRGPDQAHRPRPAGAPSARSPVASMPCACVGTSDADDHRRSLSHRPARDARQDDHLGD